MSTYATRSTIPSVKRAPKRRRSRNSKVASGTFSAQLSPKAERNVLRARSKLNKRTGKMRDSVFEQSYADVVGGEDAVLLALGAELKTIWSNEVDFWDAARGSAATDGETQATALEDHNWQRREELFDEIYSTPAKTLAGLRVKALADLYCRGEFDLNELMVPVTRSSYRDWPTDQFARQILHHLMKGDVYPAKSTSSLDPL